MANYYESCASNRTDRTSAPRRNYSSSSQQSFVSAELERFSPALSSVHGSMVKIIDIQKKKSPTRSSTDVEMTEEQHRRGGNSETTGNNSINRNQNQQQQLDATPTSSAGVNSWNAQVSQRSNSGFHQNQRQEQLGELSSFESDYDLLLYLGETETEDIVDTEQSLDYQDQTWRQSICGGASLAPTIDGSFSELLGSSTTPSRNIQDFDLLNTPTPQVTSASPFFGQSYLHHKGEESQRHRSAVASTRQTPVTNDLHIGVRSSPSYPNRQPQLASNVSSRDGRSSYRNKQLECDDRECDNKVTAAFHADLAQRNRTKQDLLAPNRRQRLQAIEPNDQLKSATLDTRRRGQRDIMDEERASTMARLAPVKRDNVDELDRLLAEMSESLDLNALAKYDTRPISPERPPKRETSNIVNQQASSKDELQSAVIKRPLQIKTSSESILDEYDGASRILEQMIAEQLECGSPIGRLRSKVPARPLPPSYQPQNHHSSQSSSKRDSPKSITSGNQVVTKPPINLNSLRQPSQLRILPLKEEQEEQPPKPPAPDYFTDEDSEKGSSIIKLEAANPEVSAEDEPNNDLKESQINRMKRRTLSSMRSVRHKIGNFINQSASQNDPQVSTSAPNREGIRSLSLGRNNVEQTSGAKQKRESRSFSRRATHNNSNNIDKVDKDSNKPASESFGQQIRMRLSRSKSRVSKWLLKGSRWEKRAQSTPNTKMSRGAATQNDTEEDDNVLFQFQPGDIARNSRLEKPPESASRGDSFDQSLDRHLVRDMANRKGSATESSDFSHLSGIERGPEQKRRPPRLRSRQAAREQRAAEEQKARTESLISLKRLSNSPSPQLHTTIGSGISMGPTDELAQTTRSHSSTRRAKARNKKRRREQKERKLEDHHKDSSSSASDDEDSSSRLSESSSIRRNRQYFGQHQSRPKSCDPKSPNRSQSLRSVRSTNQNHSHLIDDPKTSSISKRRKSGKRTVSFSNLSTRRSTPTTSTFRPASALADKFPATASHAERLHPKEYTPKHLEGGVTPVGLSPMSSPAPVRAASAQGSCEGAGNRVARADELPLPRVPVRAKSTTLLGDFKQMCSELLGGHGRVNSSRPPVPPPRRSRAARSKSAGPKESDETSRSTTSDKQKRLSSLAAQLKHSAADFFSPSANEASDNNKATDRKQPAVNTARSESQVADATKLNDSSAEEKLNWCEWKPVIEVPSKRSSFARRFRPHQENSRRKAFASSTNEVGGREKFSNSSALPESQAVCIPNEAEQSNARNDLRKQHSLQLDTDSTWESSSCEGNDLSHHTQKNRFARAQDPRGRRETNADESSVASVVSFKVNDILIAAATGKPEESADSEQEHEQQQQRSSSESKGNNNLLKKGDMKLGDKLPFGGRESSNNKYGEICALVESDSNNEQQLTSKESKKQYEQEQLRGLKDISLSNERVNERSRSNSSYLQGVEGFPLKGGIDLDDSKQAAGLTAPAAMAVDVERKKEKNTNKTLEDHQQQQKFTEKKQELHNNNNNYYNNSDISANIKSDYSCEHTQSSKLEFEQPQKVCQRQFTFSSDLPAPKEIHKLHISSSSSSPAATVPLKNSSEEPTSGSSNAPSYAGANEKMALSSSKSSRVADERAKSLVKSASGDEESRRRREKEEQTKSNTNATTTDNDTQEKRLSLYENVQQPPTRKLPVWPPPQQLPASDNTSSDNFSQDKRAQQERKTETPVDENSSWSLNDLETSATVNSREVARTKRAQNKLNKEADLMNENQPIDIRRSARQPPERKLIHMLSIIQDPNDELMVTKSNDPALEAATSSSTYKQSTVSLNRQDSVFSLADNNNNNNSDSESSILQQVASNKQRLLARFEPQLQAQLQAQAQAQAQAQTQTIPNAQRGIRSSPFAEGRVANAAASSSRVKRLAKNFESAAYSSTSVQPPVAQQQQQQRFQQQQGEDDPRSEATTVSDWYDTNEQLDETELAKFLEEFDAGNSVSTGADPFVTVAESTLADDDGALAVAPSAGGRVKVDTTLDGSDDDKEDNTLNDTTDENDDLLSACDAPDLTNENIDIDDDAYHHDRLSPSNPATNEQGKEMHDRTVRARSTIDSSSMPLMMMMELSDGVRDFSTASDTTTCVSIAAAAATADVDVANTVTDERVGGDEQATTTSSDVSSVVAAHKYRPISTGLNNNNFISNNNNQTDANDNNSILKTDKTLTPHEPHNHHHNHNQQQQDQLTGSFEPKTSEATAVSVRSQVDNSFRDSLNLIIGNRQQMVVSVNTTTTSEPKQRETLKSGDPQGARKELKGLTRYYRAILRRRKGSNKSTSKPSKSSKETAEIRDYIHSSSSSNGESSDSDDSSESFEVSNSNGKISATSRAKSRKSSHLYEELERILARKVEEANGSNDASTQRSSLNGAADDEDEEYYYEGSISSTLNSGYDQVSLSSSSVSCESIPEIRQRQNLQKLYNIVKEIHSSEAKFVDTLKLLNVELRAHMEPFMSSSNLNHQSESLSLLLRHLPQLQALNENLLEELRQGLNEWPRTRKIAHVLVKIGPFLKHYSTYIRNFDSLQQQLTEAQRKYPQLAERIRQFEAQERCQRLTIQHHLLKPIQRIPQYRLLLQQYLHYLKPDDLDYEDTVSALEVVSRVAEHANQAMNEGVNFAKLLALQAKIVGKQRDIVQPGRLFIREGELLKICRKQVQPRWFVLLNDALLYLTQIQSSDILYLNNELPLDDCQVSTPSEQQANLIGQQFDTEFTVCTRARSFALVAKTREERDQWVAAFRQTIDEHQARKRSFSAVRSLSFNNNSNGLSNSNSSASSGLTHSSSSKGLHDAANHSKEQTQQQLLGLKAPLWTPDSRVSMCQLCTSSFSALFRRHHCRACGKVVCSACSSNRAPLMYLKCRAARTCDLCFNLLRANIHLYYLASNSPERSSEYSEQELKRLDDHFRTLLKSQFVKHAEWRGLAKIARTASSGSSKSAHRHLSAQQQQQQPLEQEQSHEQQQQQLQQQQQQQQYQQHQQQTHHSTANEKPPANDSGSLISGYLHRRHAHKAKWKRQWFVITRKEKVLFAYRAIDDVAHVNSLPLLGYQVDQPSEPVDGLEPSTLLRLTHLSSYLTSNSNSNSNKQPKPIIHLFKAESVGAAERWLEALKKSVVLDNDNDVD